MKQQVSQTPKESTAKTTFLRLGFANNSSSSHSLVFTGDEDLTRESNEATDFGWRNFICSSQEHKKKYLLFIIRRFWQEHVCPQLSKLYFLDNGVRYSGAVDRENKINMDVQKSLFYRWLKYHIPVYRPYSHAGLDELLKDVSVDHQSSHLFFPFNKQSMAPDGRFLGDYASRIVNDHFAIFGGNDNEDDDSEWRQDYEKHRVHPVLLLWNMFRRGQLTLSLKDKKTGEWTVSSDHGPIIKVAL